MGKETPASLIVAIKRLFHNCNKRRCKTSLRDNSFIVFLQVIAARNEIKLILTPQQRLSKYPGFTASAFLQINHLLLIFTSVLVNFHFLLSPETWSFLFGRVDLLLRISELLVGTNSVTVVPEIHVAEIML